ncbi:MAG: T9SS type A sorting domain-containing protein [bacterium]
MKNLSLIEKTKCPLQNYRRFLLPAGLLLPLLLFAQQTILSQDFNGNWSTVNPPAGWQITFTYDTSANDWHRAPDLGFNPWPANPTPYAALGTGNEEEIDDWLITPYLDFTGCSNITLRCSLGIAPGTGLLDARIYGAVDSGPFTIEVANLSGQTLTPGLVTYNLDWAANRRGVRIAFACLGESTALSYFVLDNLTITANRQASDVGILRILAPGDTVDSASLVTPSCRVFNPSNGLGSFWTVCQIGDRYRDSVWTGELGPGDSATLTFRSWRADTAGIITARFQTLLPGDLNPENDTASKKVFVKPPFFNDAAALAILAPVGMVLETTTVIPRGVIANLAPQPVTLKAFFEISFLGSPLYSDSITHHLNPGQTDTVSFAAWVATPAGTFTTFLWVSAPRDLNPENDRINSSVTVRTASHDVGTTAILAPLDTIPPGPVTPQAQIVNFGTFTEAGFQVLFTVHQSGTPVFTDSAIVTTIEPGDTALLTFRPWNAARGTYTVTCSTRLAPDNEPANDRFTRTVAVRTLLHPGWQELTPVPLAPANKPVKDGGALAYLNNRVYVLRGYKTNDFLTYDIEQDSWLILDPLPAGSGGKPIHKGGALCADGSRYLYATKGYSTYSFLRYDAWLDTWETRKDVPPGPTGKPIKGGNYLTYVRLPQGEYVYLLKGYKNEFWRYNVRADSWEALPEAPLGPSGKNSYKGGSFIVFDGTGTIYAVKGKYGEVFAFDVNTSQWLSTSFRPFPEAGMLGKKKKVKDGAGGVWWNNGMFCLKGGNTCEFWHFDPRLAEPWTELDTIPQLGTTGRKKRVKTGGGITGMGNGIFFALKGGKTSEFWCYQSPEAGPGITEKTRAADSLRLTLKLYPNPATGFVTVLLPGAPRTSALITIYDPTGRARRQFSTSQSQFTIDLRGLAPGIYFLKAQTTTATTAKLIIR